ncbi:hypothetical protein [Thermococcus zilligii]|uniref:hypothetical protein n=1 Tax=Thermococcus zilligii TaxID=54076 RepID=UPI0012FACB5D|nr:hypothetical protein [Thermococcus zilligii]
MGMRVEVPYVIFETRRGKYGLDAYFFGRLERVEHSAALIRRGEEIQAFPSSW